MENPATTVVADPYAVVQPKTAAQVDAQRPLTDIEMRIARFSRALLFALGIAVAVASIAGAGIGDDQAPSGGRLGGDFPAFYGAGGIVRAGDIDQLYDPARQKQEQTDLGLDGYLAFAYPPHVAAVYAPLSALDFQFSYALHTLFMAAAVFGAVMVLSGPVAILGRWRWPLLAAGLSFYPMFTAVGGGQNAPLTMLLLALVWRGLYDDRAGLTGVAAGLLFYRPQYALAVIGLLLLSRQGRAVAWATVTGLLTWAATAAALGAGWVLVWFDEIIPFIERDAEVNASNSISILGFMQASWGAESRPAVVAGSLGAALVIVAMMWLWANPGRFSIADRMGALAIGVTLISPHTMFYDAGLLLLAGIALLHGAGSASGRSAAVRVVALVWFAALLHILGDGIGATPLALVVFACFVAFFYRVANSSEPHSDLELSNA